MTTVQAQQAQRLFEAGGFFILPLDTQGTEFGIDGSLWVVKQNSFAGVKFLPPGLHLFVYTAPPSSTSLAAQGLSTSASASTSSAGGNPFGEGIAIRHGLFRFSRPKEIIVRKYDIQAEEVEHEADVAVEQESSAAGVGGDPLGGDAGPSSAKRAKVASTSPDETGSNLVSRSQAGRSGHVESETIISQDYLKTLDPKLAPYPFDKQTAWKTLTSLITQQTLDRVLGQDSNGDARCDALMSSLADEHEGALASTSRTGDEPSGRSQWGKKRDVNELDALYESEGGTEGTTSAEEANMTRSQPTLGSRHGKQKQSCMRFASFDLKRSWRPGAVGEEITRDARDKSWLLSHIVETQTLGAESELLAEMQLAFITFTQLQNFSALESYKAYLSLLCRSSSTFLPTTSGLAPERSLELYARFLDLVLQAHLDYLRLDFFNEDLPSLDTFLCGELAALRMSLRAAYRIYSNHNDNSFSILFRQVYDAWNKLRGTAEEKFGWELGGLEPDDMTILRQNRGKITYNLLAEPDEEDEYTEEGEDAPVVVEM